MADGSLAVGTGTDWGMARPVWSGSISFGLVNVPVQAMAAVRDHDVHFHQLDRKSGARVRNKHVSEKTGREVAADDIEMGFEVSSGHYVTFEKDELHDLRPASTRAIEVTDFVALTEIDPIYYERTYWLVPTDEAAAKPYRLLLSAMEQRDRAAIGTVVMRNKEYLTAIRPLDGALAMSTMRFADEIVPRAEIDGMPRRAKPDAKQLRMAEQLIEALSADWHPSDYHDTYAEELRRRIAARDNGKHEPVAATSEADDGKMLDLMKALEASVEGAKHRRAPARRKAAKKVPRSA
ncbi:MAG: Ku protein [Acidimicrobiales bacterium]|nr:Ku protein [Acidimicrobiales bacterium]